MSLSKLFCVAVVGSIIFTAPATAGPPTTGRTTTQAAKAQHKHAKLRKLLRKHHLKHHARRNGPDHAKGHLETPTRPL